MIFPENSTQKENKGGQTMDDRAILFRDLDLACITSDGVCIHPPSPVSDPDFPIWCVQHTFFISDLRAVTPALATFLTRRHASSWRSLVIRRPFVLLQTMDRGGRQERRQTSAQYAIAGRNPNNRVYQGRLLPRPWWPFIFKNMPKQLTARVDFNF